MRVEFPCQIPFRVGEVAFDGVDVAIIGEFSSGKLEGGGDREAVENVVFFFPAGRADSRKNLHGLTIPTGLGSTGNQHLFHEIVLGKQSIHAGLVFSSLLGIDGQAARRGIDQDHT